MKIFRINSLLRQEGQDKALRSKMQGHSHEPPAYLWDKIENDIPVGKRKRYFLYYMLPFAALLAGIAIYLGQADMQATQPQLAIAGNNAYEHITGFEAPHSADGFTVHPEGNAGFSILGLPLSGLSNSTAAATLSGQTNLGVHATHTSGSSALAGNRNTYTQREASNTRKHSIHNIAAEGMNTSAAEKLTDAQAEEHNNTVSQKLTFLKQADILQNLAERNRTGIHGRQLDGYRQANKKRSGLNISLGITTGLYTVSSFDSLAYINGNKGQYAEPVSFSANKELPGGQFARHAGLEVKIPLSAHFSISTGLQYTELQLASIHNEVVLKYMENPLIDSATIHRLQQEAKAGNQDAIDFLQSLQANGIGSYLEISREYSRAWDNYRYLNFPLKLRYDQQLSSRFGIFAESGISTRILLSHTFNYQTTDGENVTLKLSPKNDRLQFAALASAGASYRFSNRLQLELAPSLACNLGSLKTEQSLTYKTLSGIQGRLMFQF